MKRRALRQLAIKKVIAKGKISNQEELLAELRMNGYDLTQATLSRDLKALRVAKVPDDRSGYIYRIPDKISAGEQVTLSRVNYLADGFLSLQVSGNLAVIKTLPGYASSIATVIDKASIGEIMGTIAGDDTILIIMHEGMNENQLKDAMIAIMPKLEEKLI